MLQEVAKELIEEWQKQVDSWKEKKRDEEAYFQGKYDGLVEYLNAVAAKVGTKDDEDSLDKNQENG